jgi:RNA polymerase sigma-70 factor (ECF subfamily)
MVVNRAAGTSRRLRAIDRDDRFRRVNKALQKLSITQEATPDRKADSDKDLELVRRAQEGDKEAFGQLVSRYQRKVFTIALGMVKNPDDAMDIAQDAFIKVHRYIGNFQGSSSFYTWLYRIIVNLCIDHLRRSGNQVTMDFDEKIGQLESGRDGVPTLASGAGGNPSRDLGRKELAQHIRHAVDALPPYHRAVIIMREVEGMSYADMAKTMRVSKGTIMSRLHHARQKLQRSLGEYLDGDLVVK